MSWPKTSVITCLYCGHDTDESETNTCNNCGEELVDQFDHETENNQ